MKLPSAITVLQKKCTNSSARQLVTPVEIRQKARRLVAPAIDAWLAGNVAADGQPHFPIRIRANLRPPKSMLQPAVIRWVTELRDSSKSQLGWGYALGWEQRRSRTHGDNLFPAEIRIDSMDDLLKLTRMVGEFKTLELVVKNLRQRLPNLEIWLSEKRNWKKLLEVADCFDDLAQVVEYLRDHPQPDCYLRELPLAVSTKLIETHKPLLRDWLDRTLAPEHVDFGAVDQHDFERRYGFRRPRQHLLVRLLDPALHHELGFPCDEFSLPADELDKMDIADVHVTVVENKINLLTLPSENRGIALGGLGNNLSEFSKIAWLADQPIRYWGDLDIEGLEILARFRHRFPQTNSLMMDAITLEAHRQLWTPRVYRAELEPPAELLPDELAAYRICRGQSIRLEQEHIPQSYVQHHFNPR
ncbi:MAG: DUF2220 family protein [Pirellulaceae bacterium]